jgi:hypothetical protein
MKLTNIKKNIFFIFCYSIIVSAVASDRYINILDTDGIWKDRIRLINQNNSLINLQFINGDNAIDLYKVEIISSNEKKLNDMFYSNKYFLRIFKRTDIEYFKITEKPIYSSKYSKYLHVEIDHLKQQEGMLPVINTDNLTALHKLDAYKSLLFHETNIDKDKANKILLEVILQILDFSSHMSRQVDIQSQLQHKNILKTFTAQGFTLLEIPDATLLDYITRNVAIDDATKLKNITIDIENAVFYLFEEGFVHGDITLSNLFVKNNTVVLSGFENSGKINSSDAIIAENSFYTSYLSSSRIKFLYKAIKKTEPDTFNDLEFYRDTIHDSAPLTEKSSTKHDDFKILCSSKTITTADDMYCLGIVFSLISYHTITPKYFYLLDIKMLRTELGVYYFKKLYKNQQLNSALFNRFPYQQYKIITKWFFDIFSLISWTKNNYICALDEQISFYISSIIFKINIFQEALIKKQKKHDLSFRDFVG